MNLPRAVVLIVMLACSFELFTLVSCRNMTEPDYIQKLFLEGGFYGPVDSPSDDRRTAIEFTYHVRDLDYYYGGYSIRWEHSSGVVFLYMLMPMEANVRYTVRDTFRVSQSQTVHPVVQMQVYRERGSRSDQDLYAVIELHPWEVKE